MSRKDQKENQESRKWRKEGRNTEEKGNKEPECRRIGRRRKKSRRGKRKEDKRTGGDRIRKTGGNGEVGEREDKERRIHQIRKRSEGEGVEEWKRKKQRR